MKICDIDAAIEPFKYQLHDRKDILKFNVVFDHKKANIFKFCQQDINKFNEAEKVATNNIEYITSVLELCTKLQRAHLFNDANGRIYFALVNVLLLKKGLWLTRQPFHIWSLIDGEKPENLAVIYNGLCIPAPILKKPIENWWLSLPHDEMVRIACVTGDKEMIDCILSKHPRYMDFKFKFKLNKFSVEKTALNIMKSCNKDALYKYTINQLKEKKQLENQQGQQVSAVKSGLSIQTQPEPQPQIQPVAVTAEASQNINVIVNFFKLISQIYSKNKNLIMTNYREKVEDYEGRYLDFSRIATSFFDTISGTVNNKKEIDIQKQKEILKDLYLYALFCNNKNIFKSKVIVDALEPAVERKDEQTIEIKLDKIPQFDKEKFFASLLELLFISPDMLSKPLT